MITVMRIHQLFSVVLSLSMLLSAAEPLLQIDCLLLDDRSSHTSEEHHSAGMYPPTSASESGLPCAPSHDATPTEPAPCSQHAAPCCTFQAVTPTETEAVLLESSRIASDELILPQLPNTLFQIDARASLFGAISSPRYSACPLPSDRQAFLGIFLI